ncbi:hypothetical protein [Symbioplanes lichenis]|uniref:hypothetical protein n=1 Tax=Symbioplanes lichenis TaxID=1629072 RepID=UPI00273865C8|nr:hypothetical protein [Actinoplanes lichenis]
MNHETIRAVVLPAALPAAFEAACLVACTDVSRLSRVAVRERPAHPALFAEFNQPSAAGRLIGLLRILGHEATATVREAGGRRRYSVHGVLVAPQDRALIDRTLATAWRQGQQALLATEQLGASSPRHAQRMTLARAAWQAALRSCGSRRRRDEALWVRLGDQALAAVLIRAARLLGVRAEVVRRPGCLLVIVPATMPEVAAFPRTLGEAVAAVR